MNKEEKNAMWVFLHQLNLYMSLANVGCMESREKLMDFRQKFGGKNGFLSAEWQAIYREVDQTIRDSGRYLN